MAMDVTAANQQALQLASCADELRQAKNQLLSYNSSLGANWQGEEVKYILQAIDQNVAKINKLIAELEDLSGDVKSAAAAIKREEDAAAEAARKKAAQEKAAKENAAKEKAAQEQAAREKAQRIAQAQKAYDEAQAELKRLQEKKKQLQKELDDAFWFWDKAELRKQLEALEDQIRAATATCEKRKEALKKAKS